MSMPPPYTGPERRERDLGPPEGVERRQREIVVALAGPRKGLLGFGSGGSDVDRVPQHVGRRVGGGHPAGSFLF